MSRASRARPKPSRKIDRTIVRGDDQPTEPLFRPVIADVARMLWPTKTAANIAAAADCTERAAQFYLTGDRDWSGDALASIVLEVLKRHKMRNVRVRSR